MMHNHDTNETFIPMTGLWRCSWENKEGKVESVDLNPLDVISFPPGAIRRFENVKPADSGEDAILMFVIGGNGPKAEFTDAAMKELVDIGVCRGSELCTSSTRRSGLPRNGKSGIHIR